MSIDRYIPESDLDGIPYMQLEISGSYVTYQDYKNEVEALKKEIEELKEYIRLNGGRSKKA